MNWNFLDYPENADNRLEMMFEENQERMEQVQQEQREDYQRYSD